MPCATCGTNEHVTLDSNTLLHGDLIMVKGLTQTIGLVSARYRCHNPACPAVLAAKAKAESNAQANEANKRSRTSQSSLDTSFPKLAQRAKALRIAANSAHVSFTAHVNAQLAMLPTSVRIRYTFTLVRGGGYTDDLAAYLLQSAMKQMQEHQLLNRGRLRQSPYCLCEPLRVQPY